MENRKLVLLTCLLTLGGEALACAFLATALPKGAVAWIFGGAALAFLVFMVVMAVVERSSPPPNPVPGHADKRLCVHVFGTAATFIVTLSLFSGLFIGLFRILGILAKGQ